MEAMAASCACVASLESLGGYGESNGMVACDLSAEQLAQVIMALSKDPERMAALQQAAKVFAENLFARTNWAGWLQQFLRSQLT